MADTDLSISAISSQKLQDVNSAAQVSVLKQSLDQKSAVTEQLIAGATGNTPAPGTGAKLNTIA